MTHVAINEAPPAASAAAPTTVEVVDSAGRRFKLKKPGILAQFRIMETVGPETAANRAYMSLVTPLLYIAEIDGDAVAFPARKSELEALIQRLDEHGLQAVLQGVAEAFGEKPPQLVE